MAAPPIRCPSSPPASMRPTQLEQPPIVRDESSRVFLGGALQQSPPLRRPSSMVGQFSLEVNRKDEPAVCRRPLLPSSKPAEMRAFYSGTDILHLGNHSKCHHARRLGLKQQQKG